MTFPQEVSGSSVTIASITCFSLIFPRLGSGSRSGLRGSPCPLSTTALTRWGPRASDTNEMRTGTQLLPAFQSVAESPCTLDEEASQRVPARLRAGGGFPVKPGSAAVVCSWPEPREDRPPTGHQPATSRPPAGHQPARALGIWDWGA